MDLKTYILRRKFIKSLLGNLVLIALFTAFLFIPSEDDVFLVIFKSLSLLFIFFFLYVFIYTDVLKKSRIEINDEHMVMQGPFGKKVLPWSELYEACIYTMNKHQFIGIVSKKKARDKRTLIGGFNSLLGGSYYISIPGDQLEYCGLDIYDLFSLIGQYAVQKYPKESSSEEPEVPSSGLPEKSAAAVLGYCFAAALVLGFFYGAITMLVHANIIVIPIFGAMFILYIFERYRGLKNFNALSRFLLGAICSLQIAAAYVGIVVTAAILEGDAEGLGRTIIETFAYVIKEPGENLIMILLAAVIFVIVFMAGKSYRIQRYFKKLFMKKLGQCYYEKDQTIYDIYLTDPVDYDEYKEGSLVASIGKDCLLERNGKKPGAFLIPIEIIDKLGIAFNTGKKTTVNGKEYLKLDFGGYNPYDKYEEYNLNCTILCSSERLAQVLRIPYIKRKNP